MRCIETLVTGIHTGMMQEINYNMRCIETQSDSIGYGQTTGINYNMRCIETALANKEGGQSIR